MTPHRTLPLTHVLEHYTTPDTFTHWDQWLATTDKEILDHAQRLINDKGDNPYFAEPITLIEAETDKDGEFHPAYVANGMHRILATHLIGQDDIAVEYGYGNTDEEDTDLSIVVYFSQDDVADNNALYTAEDDLWERLSFRHTGTHTQPWIEPTLRTHSNNISRIYLYCPNPKVVVLEDLYNQLDTITDTIPYYTLQGVALEDWSGEDMEQLATYGHTLPSVSSLPSYFNE